MPSGCLTYLGQTARPSGCALSWHGALLETCSRLALLLAQGVICKGACYQLFNGKPCYTCHQAHGPDGTGRVAPDCTYALDLSNAQCAHTH